MTTEMQAGLDEFDVLLNDVLRTVANPEIPERVRVNVQTRVWVREMKKRRPRAVVYAPEVFLAQMQPKRDARSTTAAVLLHMAAILLLFWAVQVHSRFPTVGKSAVLTELTTPPPMAPAKDTMGGGGGQRGAAPVSKGQLPKFTDTQITPPKTPVEAKIPMPEPAIEVQKDLKMANNTMPNIGLPNSPLIGSSMGDGRGSGLGGGNGSGLGAGIGGGFGAGLRKIGGGVSSPELIYKVDPEFSEEARRAKFMGIVLVNLIVDQQGRPENVHVLRGVGMGLDEKAVAAVKQYKFRPALEKGKPVPVELNVEVTFQIF
ncbi:MAG: TonB family protein [Acidobacteriaceae bacterium]|jgi:protein TonB